MGVNGWVGRGRIGETGRGGEGEFPSLNANGQTQIIDTGKGKDKRERQRNRHACVCVLPRSSTSAPTCNSLDATDSAAPLRFTAIATTDLSPRSSSLVHCNTPACVCPRAMAEVEGDTRARGHCVDAASTNSLLKRSSSEACSKAFALMRTAARTNSWSPGRTREEAREKGGGARRRGGGDQKHQRLAVAR